MQRYWRLKYPGRSEKDIIERVLSRRRISPDEFLPRDEQDVSRLSSHRIYADMERAVDKIIKARSEHESVLIYGDYDVDGITSTALMWEYLSERMDMDVTYYLPDRFRDGYGLNREALHKLKSADFDLVITVDCGITAVEEVEYLKQQKTDVIVTDHHRSGERYPRAGAILNPSCSDKIDGADINLAGVGVVFKLCQALEEEVYDARIGDFLADKLDLVALGTVADIISLRGDNRILVSQGIERIKSGSRPGLEMLMNKVGLCDCDDLTAGQIGYILAPPFNAAGRLESPDLALQLLLTDNSERAEMLAEKLHDLNRERQNLEEDIFQDALTSLQEHDISQENAIVLADEDWHQGVIGIVASRLVDRYHRPVVMIALEGEEGKGSARSISGFDLYSALKNCDDYLKDYGGHSQAAGLTVRAEEIRSFSSCFRSRAERVLSAEDYVPDYRIDAMLNPEEITRVLYEDIQKLRPFGAGNPEPVFMTGDIRLKSARRVGGDKSHLKIKTESGMEGIGFGLGEAREDIPGPLSGKKVKLLYRLSLNNWQGREQLQFKFKDILISEDSHKAPVIYEDETLKVYDVRDGDMREYLNKLGCSEGSFCIYFNRKKRAEDFRERFAGFDIITSLQEMKKGHRGVVFCEPPFTFSEIVLGTARLNEKADKKELHLLFSREELETNKRILDNKLPDAETLEYMWEKMLTAEEEIISHEMECFDEQSRSYWQNAVDIFCECGMIEREGEGYKIIGGQSEFEPANSERFERICGIRNSFSSLREKLELWNLNPFFNTIKQEIKAEEE